MASRILHLAVAEKIIEGITISNQNRFRLGVILPDAHSDSAPKADSHLEIRICEGTKKTYDLLRFQNIFGAKITTDDLYIGYYLHLIQDLIYRRLVYEEYRWNPLTPGNVQRLWNDYKLINSYIITKYGLKNDLTIPVNFAEEELAALYPFDTDTLYDNLNHDFEESEYTKDEAAFFFTKDMADEFIGKAAKVCVEEIKAIRAGSFHTKYDYYAW